MTNGIFSNAHASWVDIVTVATRLGHSQTSTTLNIYAHSDKKSNKATAGQIGFPPAHRP